MSRRRGQGASKARAIRNALARLGMQASAKQVVAALAGFGIGVTDAQVGQVKVEMLKQAAKAVWQQAMAPQVERPPVRRPPKAPPQRGHRS